MLRAHKAVFYTGRRCAPPLNPDVDAAIGDLANVQLHDKTKRHREKHFRPSRCRFLPLQCLLRCNLCNLVISLPFQEMVR